MVALDGLEPSLPKKPDFESSVSTNSTTAPLFIIFSKLYNYTLSKPYLIRNHKVITKQYVIVCYLQNIIIFTKHHYNQRLT